MQREEIYRLFAERFSFPRMKEAAPVTVAALDAIEGELKITLPNSYRSFITRYGPLFTPDVSEALGECAVVTPPEEEVFAVREFLPPPQILRDYRVCVGGGMPEEFVPFAFELGGSLFGFTRELRESRPDDAPVLVFDCDNCTVRTEAESFDAWLEYFVTLRL